MSLNYIMIFKTQNTSPVELWGELIRQSSWSVGSYQLSLSLKGAYGGENINTRRHSHIYMCVFTCVYTYIYVCIFVDVCVSSQETFHKEVFSES